MAELERYVRNDHPWFFHAPWITRVRRGKVREKMLERELEKLAGVNWQVCNVMAVYPLTSSATTLNLVHLVQPRTGNAHFCVRLPRTRRQPRQPRQAV